MRYLSMELSVNPENIVQQNRRIAFKIIFYPLICLTISGVIFAAEQLPKKPIECFSDKLTPQEGIECLRQLQQRRNFEATIKALQK